MKGSVLTDEKCPSCHCKFQKVLVDYGNRKVQELVCQPCLTRPQRFFIQIYLNRKLEPDPKKRTLRIYSNNKGYSITSYEEASRMLEQIRREIRDGLFIQDHYRAGRGEGLLGRHLLKKWLRTKEGKSPTHRKELERYVRLYYEPFFGDRDLRTLNAITIEDFHFWLEDRQKELGRPLLSLKTQKNVLTMLRNFCRWLHDRDVIIKVPMFPKIQTPAPPIVWITKEDQLRILEAIPKQHQPIFLFMFYHPLRAGEVRALKVKDVDLAAVTLHVERAWSSKELRHRKNGKDYYIPLSQTFDSELVKGAHPEAWLFRQKDGRPYSHAWLRDIFNGALDAAGMKRIPLKNATRHSIASQAVNRGVPLANVSKALGHSSIQVTADRYAKMEVDSLRNVLDEDNLVSFSDGILTVEED